MIEIIPALLPKNVSELEEGVSKLPDTTKIFHLDILDDNDVWSNNIETPFEVHLMVKEPNKITNLWLERGAKRIITHKIGEEATKLRERVEIGLAVELHIPLEEVYSLVSKVDFVQLMSIREIGAQGHPLDEKIFDRIKKVRDKFPELIISVDGGVNISNYQSLLDLGVNRLVVGSGFNSLWNSLTKK